MQFTTKIKALILTLVVFITLPVLLSGCGGTPLNPTPIISVISVNGATVPIPTSSTAAAAAAANFVVNVTGPTIVIDTDTRIRTDMNTGVVTTYAAIPFNLSIVPPVGGSSPGVWNMSYSYTNGLDAAGNRIVPSGTFYSVQHIYAYHTTPGNVNGKFSVVYQVLYN